MTCYLSPSTVFDWKSDHGRVCVVDVPTNSKLLGYRAGRLRPTRIDLRAGRSRIATPKAPFFQEHPVAGVKIYSPPNRVTRHGELSRGLPTGVTLARLGCASPKTRR